MQKYGSMTLQISFAVLIIEHDLAEHSSMS